MSVKIIVACDPQGVIGKDNKLPWRLPEDLKMFREKTMGHVVICGRKTYESIPEKRRPLDGRTNIVLSRSKYQHSINIDGPYYSASLKSSILGSSNKDVFIIGGATVYKEALDEDLVDEIILTRLKESHSGNIFFPILDKNKWMVQSIDESDPWGKDFSVITLKRENNNLAKGFSHSYLDGLMK